MDIISAIAKEVEAVCRNKNNNFGFGVWSHHIMSVVEYSKLLAIELGADQEITQLAALLHDYAGIKDYNLYKDHHIHSANEAEKLLEAYHYPEDRIALVKQCIFTHRGSVPIEKLSIEAICVADADAIAHIENVPSLLYLAYHHKNMSIEEGMLWVSDKIERSYNKLSNHGREIIEHKYNNSKRLLNIA